MKRSILVIPDAHAHPHYDHKRFATLGRFAAQVNPGVVVCLGDFADMVSLSTHDAGEGRRYQLDCQAAQEANELLFRPFKGKRRKPAFKMALGNHEDRIERTLGEDPKMKGKIAMSDLGYEEAGWDVSAFQEVMSIQGWAISHNFPSGDKGLPIGGENIARGLLKGHMSAIAGHSHRLQTASECRWDGKHVHTIVAGCYVHPKMKERWNRATFKRWWFGVTLLEGCEDGQYEDIKFVSMGTIDRLGKK